MSIGLQDFAQELDEQGREYLEGLQNTIDEIEHDILSLTDPSAAAESLKNIARNAHSIKGTAGVFKYDLISALCHFFEDRITGIRLSNADLESHIDGLLRYVDAIGSSAQAYLRHDNKTIEEISRKFAIHHDAPAKAQPRVTAATRQRVLIIEKMGPLMILANSALKERDSSQLDIAISHNGYDGLGRLLRERFNCVLMSNLSEVITGVELINMLEVVHNPNMSTPFILLTSDEKLKKPDSSRPIEILMKGADLKTRLKNQLTRFLGEAPVVAPAKPLEIHDILVVDDSIPIQRLVKMVLSKTMKIEPRIASTGAEALAQLAAKRPDFAVLDFQLPDMDGVELAKKMKAIDPTIPFVFLTAAESAEEKAHLATAGPRGILKKPFPPNDLVNLLLGRSTPS